MLFGMELRIGYFGFDMLWHWKCLIIMIVSYFVVHQSWKVGDCYPQKQQHNTGFSVMINLHDIVLINLKGKQTCNLTRWIRIDWLWSSHVGRMTLRLALLCLNLSCTPSPVSCQRNRQSCSGVKWPLFWSNTLAMAKCFRHTNLSLERGAFSGQAMATRWTSFSNIGSEYSILRTKKRETKDLTSSFPR